MAAEKISDARGSKAIAIIFFMHSYIFIKFRRGQSSFSRKVDSVYCGNANKRALSLKHFYFDIPEPNIISVILQVDVTSFEFGKAYHLTEFTSLNEVVPILIPKCS